MDFGREPFPLVPAAVPLVAGELHRVLRPRELPLHQGYRQDLPLYALGEAAEDLGDLPLVAELDPVGHFETRLLAGELDSVDQLPQIALRPELIVQAHVQSHGIIAFFNKHKPLRRLPRDLDVGGEELDVTALDPQAGLPLLLEHLPKGGVVGGGEGGGDLRGQGSEPWAQGGEVGGEDRPPQLVQALHQRDFLHVELCLRQLPQLPGYRLVARPHPHQESPQGLADLHLRPVPRRQAQLRHRPHPGHPSLQHPVPLPRLGPRGKMYRLRIGIRPQRTPHRLGQEGGEGGDEGRQGLQGRIKAVVAGELSVGPLAAPEPGPGEADVPVGEIVDVPLQGPAGLHHLVGVEIPGDLLHRLGGAGKQPAIEERAFLGHRHPRIEPVDPRV